MMRATAPGAPHRLEHDGLINAISTMLEQISSTPSTRLSGRSPKRPRAYRRSDLAGHCRTHLAAIQEALRNAARHARALTSIVASASTQSQLEPPGPQLEVLVADNGVGITSTASATTGLAAACSPIAPCSHRRR